MYSSRASSISTMVLMLKAFSALGRLMVMYRVLSRTSVQDVSACISGFEGYKVHTVRHTDRCRLTKVMCMPAGCSIFCNMSIPANWEEHSFEDWKKKVADQELKEHPLRKRCRVICMVSDWRHSIQTDRQKPAMKKKIYWESNEQSGMQMAGYRFIQVHGRICCIHPAGSFTEQISGCASAGRYLFLDQLAKEVPLPVALCLEAESVPASEDEVLEWRDRLRKAKAHHPFSGHWSLTL